METVDQKRPWWKLHFLSTAWLASFCATCVLANLVADWSYNFGWPLTFSAVDFFSPSWGDSITFTWFFASAPKTPVSISCVAFNAVACLMILVLSTVAVEWRLVGLAIPSYRFTLRGLFVLITWLGIGYLFLWRSKPSTLESSFLIRAHHWSLLVIYAGIGLAMLGAVDLFSLGFNAVVRRIQTTE